MEHATPSMPPSDRREGRLPAPEGARGGFPRGDAPAARGLARLALMALGLLVGCASVYEPGVTVQPPLRVLGPTGSLAQASVAALPVPPEYRINPGDQISIRFPRRPAYSDTFLVRADGRITAPAIGSVMAASLTPDELQVALTEQYRRLVSALPPPEERSYAIQPDDVLDVRFSYFSDFNSVVTVRTDGRISLPMIGDVVAEGVTPSALQERLMQLYGNRIPNPDLVVMVKEARTNVFVYKGRPRLLPDPGLIELAVNVTKTVPLVVFVGGEVPAPGLQPFVAGSNALQAIYSAGGPAPSGDMRSVVILRRGADESVVRLVADLSQDVAGTGTGNTVIQPFDIVVVPRATIVQVGDALDQYIYRIVRPLANSSLSFYFTKQIGTVHQETSVVPGQP